MLYNPPCYLYRYKYNIHTYIHSEVMNKQKKHDDCNLRRSAVFKCIVARYETGTQRVYSTRLIYSRVCITTTNHVVIRYGISYCIIASNRSTYTLYAHSDLFKYIYRVVVFHDMNFQYEWIAMNVCEILSQI